MFQIIHEVAPFLGQGNIWRTETLYKAAVIPVGVFLLLCGFKQLHNNQTLTSNVNLTH